MSIEFLRKSNGTDIFICNAPSFYGQIYCLRIPLKLFRTFTTLGKCREILHTYNEHTQLKGISQNSLLVTSFLYGINIQLFVNSHSRQERSLYH